MSNILSFYTNSPQEFFKDIPEKMKSDRRIHDAHNILYLIVKQQTKLHGYLKMTYAKIQESTTISLSASAKYLKDLKDYGYIYRANNNYTTLKHNYMPSKQKKKLKPSPALSTEDVIKLIGKRIEAAFICVTHLRRLLSEFGLMTPEFLKECGLKFYNFGRKTSINKKELLACLTETL